MAAGITHASDRTGFVNWPMPSISTVTVSPGLSQSGGVRAMPTPCGVPVRITVPASNVVLPLRKVGASESLTRVCV